MIKREEVADKYTWNLKLLFESDEEFFKLIKSVEKEMVKLKNYEGKLASGDKLFEFLGLEKDISLKLNKVYLYAFLKKSINGASGEALEQYGLASDLLYKFSNITAFETSELAGLDDSVLKEFAREKRFENHDRMLNFIIRNKPHTLSAEEEKLLSNIGKFADFDATFDALDNIEIKFKSVRLPDGEKTELTNATYTKLIKHTSQDVRKQAFVNLHKGYKKFNITLSQNYINQVKKDDYFAKAYRFKKTLTRKMFIEEVDYKVYKTLINTVKKNLPYFYEFQKVKKNLLGLNKFYNFDNYASVEPESHFKLKFEDALQLVKDATAVIGKDYTATLQKAFDERWIDVFPAENKDKGAFSIGYSQSNPFVLVNYFENFGEISTLAHELGHAMHSYYSNRMQPHEKSHYVIFVAEVASTVNELLLVRHLLKTTTDKKLKRFLIDNLTLKFYTTIFRQTMFAEFEERVHRIVETGKPISFNVLNKLYARLLRKYFGKDVSFTSVAKYEWSRIPHFYRSFYVYKYAIGLISAVYISGRLLNEGEEYASKYREFLSSGCKTDPVSLLKLADLDITKEETFNSAFDFYRELIENLKSEER